MKNPAQKKVLRITDPLFYGNSDANHFIDRCILSAAYPKKKEELSINLSIPENRPDFFSPLISIFRSRKQDLSFKITDQEILRISNDIVRILQDPKLVAKHLTNLDKALKSKVSLESGIELDKITPPEYIISGRGNFIAGPPPEGYKPLKKGRTLDQMLLERERQSGINLENATPKFIGAVPGKEAVEFVTKGHIFAEDEQISRMLIHGKYSHRLTFEIIRQAVAANELDFSLESGSDLTQRQLLEVLNRVQIGETDNDKMSLWEAVLDNVIESITKADTLNAAEKYGLGVIYEKFFDHQNYSYSSGSPFVAKSLLTCFGSELGLPNLQSYLLDSHWKQADKMICRVRDQDKNGKLKEVSDSDLYSYCMIGLSTGSALGIGDIGFNFSFSSTIETQVNDPKYQKFSEESVEGIKSKPSPTMITKGENHYASWQDYRKETGRS